MSKKSKSPKHGDDPLNEPAMIIYENPEKKLRRQLGDGEYMVRTSDRILISGMPGSGKRVLILNIINRIKPKYLKAIHIVHSDPNTIEYDCLSDIGVPIYMYAPEDMPTIENIEHPDGSDAENEEAEDGESGSGSDLEESKMEEKEGKDEKLSEKEENSEEEEELKTDSVIIIDECPTHTLGKTGRHRMERIVNHCATHKNCLVLCSIQNLTNLPPNCRRGFNAYALYKQADSQCNHMAAQRSGITPDMLMDMFCLCPTKHDFIFIDLDREKDDPMRFRLNWFYPITIESAEAETNKQKN